MQAVVAPQPDGAEELALVERPVPRPGRGEVLVKVRPLRLRNRARRRA
jgi:NADPH:quinone reductase-like Zn-dependent oxidoreductase